MLPSQGLKEFLQFFDSLLEEFVLSEDLAVEGGPTLS